MSFTTVLPAFAVPSSPNHRAVALRNRVLLLPFFFAIVLNTMGQRTPITDTFKSSIDWVCPPNVTTVLVQCWGGGGSGGNAGIDGPNSFVSTGGGAGGAYASKVVSVVPGTAYKVTVGERKSTEDCGAPECTNGKPSWFGTEQTVYAEGGQGGASAFVGPFYSWASQGGNGSSSSSIGTIVWMGGNGAGGAYVDDQGQHLAAGGGGSSAGPLRDGNNGEKVQGGTAPAGGGNGGSQWSPDGEAPGGGGAGTELSVGMVGDIDTKYRKSGGAGAAGQIVLQYLPVITYYTKAEGPLHILSTWGTNKDGSGIQPTSFSDVSQLFVITNRATATLETAWIISGGGSKLITGDGISPTNFIVPASFAYPGIVDVAANATITLVNTTLPSFGELAPTSTVDFAGNVFETQIIPVAAYGHLTHSGRNVAIITKKGITIAGNLTQNGGNLIFENKDSINVDLAGDYVQLQGNLSWNIDLYPTKSSISVKGDIKINAGGSASSMNSGTFIFAGSGVQNLFIKTPADFGYTNYMVNPGSTLKLNSTIYIPGSFNPEYSRALIVRGTLDAGSHVIESTPLAKGIFTLLPMANFITSHGNGVEGFLNKAQLITTLSSGANYEFQGASTGVFTTLPLAATVNNLIINSPTGVANSQPIKVAGRLMLMNGIFTTTQLNSLTLINDSADALAGGSGTSFINGPLNRSIAAALSGSQSVYNFPVGVGTTFLPYSFSNVNTGAVPPVVQVSAFNVGSGGTTDNSTLFAISGSEYWKTTVMSGDYLGASLSLGRPAALDGLNCIGKTDGDSPAGSYSFLGGKISANAVAGSNQTGLIAVGNSQFSLLAAQGNTITVLTDANGTISPTGTSMFPLGLSQTYTIVPNPCYAIDKVIVDGLNNPAAVGSGFYTFSNIIAPHSVIVTFKPIGSPVLAIHKDIATTNITSNKKLLAADLSSCRMLGEILPNGSNPVAGGVTAKVWVDSTVQSYTYLGIRLPYVQRHYDITPQVNADSATARLTLYFSQTEFNTYNVKVNSALLSLPTGPNDFFGRSRLGIYQIHGTSTDDTGTPGSYRGSLSASNPGVDNVIWNDGLKRWEVSFNVNGFSGFFVGVNLLGALPVKLVSFTGALSSGNTAAGLQWEVAAQQGITKYVVEKSTDGNNYQSIGSVAANQLTSSKYNFEDALTSQPTTASSLYYRLKIIGMDGNITYSQIVRLSLNSTMAGKITLYPNPVRKGTQLQISISNGVLRQYKLITATGQVLLQKDGLSINGTSSLQLPAAMAVGVYYLQLQTDKGMFNERVIVK